MCILLNVELYLRNFWFTIISLFVSLFRLVFSPPKMDANLVYDEKLSELQVYRQYLENWLRKNEGAVQENKMKTLYDLVSGRKR